MSKTESIVNVWNSHWGHTGPAVFAIMKSRFAQEAYRKINVLLDETDRSILEIGCGTGRFCALLALEHPKSKITGVDLSENALAIARRETSDLPRDNLSFMNGNLLHLPFPDDHFDMAFSEGVIQLFPPSGSPTCADALAEMTRVVKPGGKVIVSVINWHCFPHTFYKWLLERRRIPYEYGYEKSFKRRELESLFREHGLNQVQFSGYYAAHAFYRHAGRSRLFRGAGLATDALEKSCDLIRKDWFSKNFGFEIVASGIKPHPGQTLHQ